MKRDPRVDTYIAKAPAFARPILKHLRAVVGKTCPDAAEAIKWNQPMFSVQGKLFCGMAAFKAHCRFLVFGPEVRKRMAEDGRGDATGPGSLGKLTSLADLPGDRALATYLRLGAAQIAAGKSPMARRRRPPRPLPKMPPQFAAALKRNRAAQSGFAGLSPSCQREYLEWIADAKREETRQRRIAQALAQVAEGKRINWRYER